MHFTTPETRKARKSQQCTVCYRVIDPGETYRRGRGFDGGDAWTWADCAHCFAVQKLYDPSDYEGMTSSDSVEQWIENGARDIAEARCMAGVRMKWRTKSGALMPVPDVEIRRQS